MGRDTHPFLGPKDPAPQVPARTWCPTIPTQPGSSSTWFEASHLYNWETLGHPMTSLLTGKMGTDLTAWSSYKDTTGLHTVCKGLSTMKPGSGQYRSIPDPMISPS